MAYEPSSAAIEGRRILGRQLRALRAERGMTQEALAAAAGLDRSFLVDVEHGRHSIMLDRLFDVADALQVPADALLQADHDS